MDPSTNQLSSEVKSSSSAAPLVPLKPDWRKANGTPKPEYERAANLEAWGTQCAEIAQAQARRADEAEKELSIANCAIVGHQRAHKIHETRIDALQARVAELEEELAGSDGVFLVQATSIKTLHATLAQRDREVLGLRKALAAMDDAFSEEMERDVIEEIGGASEKSSGWVAVLLARAALSATAQAGAEAERRIREDEREGLRRFINHWKDCSGYCESDDRKAMELCDCGLAAILGTGGEVR